MIIVSEEKKEKRKFNDSETNSTKYLKSSIGVPHHVLYLDYLCIQRALPGDVPA